MSYIRVKDKDYLYRDVNSNAIINTDYNLYEKYIDNYKKIYKDKEKLEQIENDVNDIKNDLNDIKNLLRGLISGTK